MSPREKILHYIKELGPQRADDISNHLGVTAMAVRQHLYAMRDDGLLEERRQSSIRGRPAKLWALAPNSDDYFPDSHRDLALGLIDTITSAFGAQAMETLLDQRLQDQSKQYLAELSGLESMSTRLAKLCEIRSREGYMAHVHAESDDLYILAENHCPICAAANVCKGLCAKELTLFRNVLGSQWTVDRTDHILQGARRCAYKIERRKSD